MRVIDASVAAKWFLAELDRELALDLLRENIPMIAPALVKSEVSGAIIRAWRKGNITSERALEAILEWEKLLAQEIIVCIPQDELYDLAVKMAFETRHALHDCFYLAAGRRFKVEVITAEPTLQKRGRSAGERVILLAEFGPGYVG